MSDTCSKCIPIRLRTAKSEPLTPIVWAHPDFETLGQFIVPSEKDGERFDAKLDVLKRTRTLIGDTLVWEINIAPHDPTPKTLLGRLKQRWDAALQDRRAHPVQWFLIGIALGMAAIALGWLMWDGLVSLVSYPLASMVWVWVKLGVFLPLVALFVAVYFVASVARTDKPFNFGLVMVFAAAGPILAILIADTLFGFLPDDACAGDETCFPDAYDAAGRAVLQMLVAKTATFYSEVELIWTPLTLLLNGIGLAGVIAIIDKVGGWAVALQKSGDLEGSNANILQEQAARAAQAQQRDFMLAQARSGQQSQNAPPQRQRLIPQFTLKLPLEPLPADEVDDEILEPPAHC